jgi:predicted phosphodiesterase
MRLGIFSDIHGNALALEAALADLQAAGGADRVWVLGDLCAFGPRPAECVQMIRDLKAAEGVQVISGNTDRYLVTGARPLHRAKDEADFATYAAVIGQREAGFAWTLSALRYADYEYLAALRGELDLHVPDYGWLVGYHGSPGNDEYNLLPDTPAEEVLDQLADREGRLGVGGHTHRAMDRDLGAWRVVNAGSVGMPLDEVRACYALVTLERDHATVALRRVAYDVDAVIRDLQGRNPAWEWVANRLRSPLG